MISRCYLIFSLINSSLAHAQPYNNIQQISTSGNDLAGKIIINDYWGKIVSGNVDGVVSLGFPQQYSGAFIGLFDSTNNIFACGDPVPSYELTSKMNSPSLLIGSNHTLFIIGYSKDTTRFGNTISSNGNDSVTFLAEILEGGWASNREEMENVILSDATLDYNMQIICAGKILNSTGCFLCDPSTAYTPYNVPDILIFKMDTSGIVQWFREAGGFGTGEDAANAVTTDTQGNIYVSGHIHSDALFDSLQLPQHDTSDYDGFIAKYNTSGSIQWVKYAGYDALDVATDTSGNCYVAGYAVDTSWFDSTQLVSSSDHTMFLAKYDTNGNLVWVKENNSAAFSQTNSITLDSSLNCYATGLFSGTILTGATSSIASSTCIPDTGKSGFLVCYDSTGTLQWGKAFQSCNTSSSGNGVDFRNCEIAVAGSFQTTPNAVHFDNDSLVGNGGGDGFYFTVDNCIASGLGSSEPLKNKTLEVFPNPFSSFVAVHSMYRLNGTATISNEIGKVLFQKEIQQNETIDLSFLPAGIYVFKFISDEEMTEKKMVKVE